LWLSRLARRRWWTSPKSSHNLLSSAHPRACQSGSLPAASRAARIPRGFSCARQPSRTQARNPLWQQHLRSLLTRASCGSSSDEPAVPSLPRLPSRRRLGCPTVCSVQGTVRGAADASTCPGRAAGAEPAMESPLQTCRPDERQAIARRVCTCMLSESCSRAVGGPGPLSWLPPSLPIQWATGTATLLRLKGVRVS